MARTGERPGNWKSRILFFNPLVCWMRRYRHRLTRHGSASLGFSTAAHAARSPRHDTGTFHARTR
ncbi:msr8709 [Mesorhizobium japonicum MAFF 303099]|uniref:Msr8709 protein n=1 Tax=Mesorhizobium japonicum (strain LMG 29417 / CECT 9101 / MAFF 303099) TaxID=266835 RepID=Q987N2_RHILO|nr:msr8709 [Mesorhizobium japonicum MAFF 303099]